MTITVELAVILQIASALGVLIAVIAWIWKLAHKTGDTKTRFTQLEKLPARVDALEAVYARIERLEVKADHRKEDSQMTLKGVRACLEGMKEMGCNGEVTKMSKELNDYIVESR